VCNGVAAGAAAVLRAVFGQLKRAQLSDRQVSWPCFWSTIAAVAGVVHVFCGQLKRAQLPHCKVSCLLY
jgi:membrane-associated HD superfamily phosphohydrolase